MVEMVEFEDAGTERMAQLEQEDLERYQRDVLRNSSYSYDETPNYVDEFQSKLFVLLDMVRGFSSDLKQKTSSIEKGSDLPVMNLQPDSIICDEQQPDEVLVVNKVTDSMEMLDLVEIKRDDFSNSKVEPDLEEKKVSESGLMVFSIYCAHMAPKWKPVLDSQPKQSKDMSVEMYYDLFFNWKLKLEEVNYIGGEDSYIDDFIYGLDIKLGMRVWGYKWKPHTLYGAFRRAEIEETMMKNDAHMVLEEMPHSNPIDIQDAEVVLYENDVVLKASCPWDAKFQLDLPSESNSFQSVESQMDVLEASTCNVVYHEAAVSELENVKQTLSEVVKKLPVMKLECLQVACSIFDELLTQFSAKQNIGFEGLRKWDQSMVDCKDALMEMMFGEILVFMFDPGISSRFDETLKSLQGAEQVIDLYDYDVKFIKLALFDPSRRYTHPLLGKSQEMYAFGLKGVTSSRKHANLFINTCEILGLFVSSFVENEWCLAGLSSHSNNYLIHTIFGKCETIYSVNDMLMFVFDSGGCLLDLLGTSSVTSRVALQNIDVVMPITPNVLCAQVSQQLVFPIKAYSITVSLKGGDSLRNRVDRVVIIQCKKGTELLSSGDAKFLVDNIMKNLYLMPFWYADPLSSLPISTKCYLSSSLSFQLGEKALFYIISSDFVLRVVLDDPGVAQTYEKNNIAGIAFGILEYFADARMIFVLALLVGFVWDPGQDVNSFYIIEDNDVLKRKGIGIQMALELKQDDLLKGASAHYYAHTWLLACSLVDWEILLLLITSSKFRIIKSYNLKELLVTLRSVGFHSEYILDGMIFRRFDAHSELNIVVQNLINKDIKPYPQFGLAFSAQGLEHYIWDPGSFTALIGDLLSLGSSFNHVKLFSRDFKGWSPESCYTQNSVKLGLEQIDIYVNDCFRVFKSYVNKELMGHSEIIGTNILMKWSSMEPPSTFCSKQLKRGMDGHAFAIIYHSFEIHLAAAVKCILLTQSEREIQDCSSYDLGHFIWDPGYRAFYITVTFFIQTLFKFGCIALMIQFKKMLHLKESPGNHLPMCYHLL